MTNTAERTRALYDEIALQYNEMFPACLHPEHRQYFIEKLSLGARILDAGCAGGRDTDYFSKQGFKVTGVDFSAGQIACAKAKYSDVDFREADLLRLSEIFPKAEFDGIYTCATLDHLKKRDIPQALTVFNQLLKPEGILFVVTRKGKGVLWTDDTYSQHKKRRFTLTDSNELQKLLKGKGFEIEKFNTFSSSTRLNMEFNLALCRKIKDI